MTNRLCYVDFAAFFGVAENQLQAPVREAIDRGDFRYRPLSLAERDRTIRQVLQRIDSGALTPVGAHRQEVWEKGWAENLDDFSAQGFALETLMPRFMRPETTLRLNQGYVSAINPRFEFHFHDVVRRWLYCQFMPECSAVYEFGCGSAYNLVAIAQMAPHLRLVGLDWAESAVSLANLIGQKHQINLCGRSFDFFRPDPRVDLGPNDAVLTVCALEQVGDRHDRFIDFLLAKRPRICVHMEPLLELYDDDQLIDHLAIRFHTHRRYLSGFLPRLQRLAQEGAIEMVAQRRIPFGSLYHEGYSFVVWRPR